MDKAGYLMSMTKHLTAAEMRIKLKEAVAEAGSERALAKRLGFTGSYINQVVNGQVDVSRKLARAMGYELQAIYLPERAAR